MIGREYGRALVVVAALLLYAPVALADAAADAAKAEAMLAERGAEFDAKMEVHNRTVARAVEAIVASSYYKRHMDSYPKTVAGTDAAIRFIEQDGVRKQEPFKSVYEALYTEFYPQEEKRYERERR